MYAMTRARWVRSLGRVPDTSLVANDLTGILATTGCENELLEVSMKLRRWNRTEEE